MTDFAAVFPPSRVEAARMQRTITRLKVELDGDAVLARLVAPVVEFAESLDGKWAGRFHKHLEDARPVAPDQRISAPCFHAIFPLPGSVPGESPKRSNASGLLKLPRL